MFESRYAEVSSSTFLILKFKDFNLHHLILDRIEGVAFNGSLDTIEVLVFKVLLRLYCNCDNEKEKKKNIGRQKGRQVEFY